jgi:hypothetical protein
VPLLGGRRTLFYWRRMASFQSVPVEFNRRPANGEMGVAESVRTNTGLKKLAIHGVWSGDDEAEELGAALADNTSLKMLVLSNLLESCSLGARGLRGITEALKTSAIIERLAFVNIRLGDAGAEVLADLLVSTSSLTYLYMESCGVGEAGARSIADALKINSTLGVFQIRGNKIGDAGAAAIADALAKTTSLKNLDLFNCGTGEQGALALGRAIGSNLALPFDFFPFDFYLTTCSECDRLWNEAERVRAFVLRKRELLLAFGMAMLERLGGGTEAQARSTRSSREASVFHKMNKDVFKLVGEAYGDY